MLSCIAKRESFAIMKKSRLPLGKAGFFVFMFLIVLLRTAKFVARLNYRSITRLAGPANYYIAL